MATSRQYGRMQIHGGEEWRSYEPLYKELAHAVHDAPWFHTGGWTCDAESHADKCHFSLSKPHWTQHGVYFASWIGQHEIGLRNCKAAMYVLPGMPHRDAFVQSLLARSAGVLATELSGYRVLADNSFPVFLKFRLERESLVHRLLREFNKLQGLGAPIDQALEALTAAE